MIRVPLAIICCLAYYAYALPDSKYGHYRFDTGRDGRPNLQGFLTKDGKYKIFGYGKTNKDYYYVDTEDFSNFTMKTIPMGISESASLVYDDKNRSGLFNNQDGGGLIRLGSDNKAISYDLGNTWIILPTTIQMPFNSSVDSNTYDTFDKWASVFYSPDLERWVSFQWFSGGGDQNTRIMIAEKSLAVFQYQIKINDYTASKYGVAEMFLMLQTGTDKKVYGLICYDSSKKYSYILGNFAYKEPNTKAELQFERYTSLTQFDSGLEIDDVLLLSEGEEIKSSRLAVVALGNFYHKKTTDHLKWNFYFLLSFPRELKIEDIGGKLMITQTPSTVFKLKLQKFPKISVSDGFKSVGCDVGVAYYLYGRFELKVAGSVVGFYIRADQKTENFTRVGYDDKDKIVFLKRSPDVIVPEDTLKNGIYDNDYFKLLSEPFTLLPGGTVSVCVIVDVITTEVFFDRGQIMFSVIEFAKEENNQILVACQGGSTEVTDVKYHVAH